MKIALIGYGKMGRMIEGIALERGNEITVRIDRDNQEDFESEAFRSSDVAIEFSTPGTAEGNVLRCFGAGVPVVCGTTGWSAGLGKAEALCCRGEGTMMWSSNYSIGVNVFRALSRTLTGMMNAFAQYRPSLTEVHHVHKLDHPSGTAITLAEDLISVSDRIGSWQEVAAPGELAAGPGVLGIAHIREGEVPGIHTIAWDSDVDRITISHSAKSRAGFALGAVMAAEWLAGRKGWYTVGEMLNDLTHQTIFNE